MALQTSGAISLNNVNVELGNSGTASINMGSTAVRDLFGVASGAISLSDGYGASAVTGLSASNITSISLKGTFNNPRGGFKINGSYSVFNIIGRRLSANADYILVSCPTADHITNSTNQEEGIAYVTTKTGTLVSTISGLTLGATFGYNFRYLGGDLAVIDDNNNVWLSWCNNPTNTTTGARIESMLTKFDINGNVLQTFNLNTLTGSPKASWNLERFGNVTKWQQGQTDETKRYFAIPFNYGGFYVFDSQNGTAWNQSSANGVGWNISDSTQGRWLNNYGAFMQLEYYNGYFYMWHNDAGCTSQYGGQKIWKVSASNPSGDKGVLDIHSANGENYGLMGYDSTRIAPATAQADTSRFMAFRSYYDDASCGNGTNKFWWHDRSTNTTTLLMNTGANATLLGIPINGLPSDLQIPGFNGTKHTANPVVIGDMIAFCTYKSAGSSGLVIIFTDFNRNYLHRIDLPNGSTATTDFQEGGLTYSPDGAFIAVTTAHDQSDDLWGKVWIIGV